MDHFAGWQMMGKRTLQAILKVVVLPLAMLLVLVPATQAQPHFQDDFSGPSLGAGWSMWDGYREQFPGDTANHAVFQMTGTQLSLSFRSGVEHNMWPLTHAQVTRLYLGSGVYEIKVNSVITGDQQFGLTFQKDHSTFMKFMLFSYADGKFRGYVERFALVNGTVARSTLFEADIPVALPASGPHYMRVVVDDNANPSLRNWKFDWSPDGSSWTEIASAVFETAAATENAGAIQQVGVFAGIHYSFPAFDARFDYFRYYTSLATAPLSSPANLVARAGNGRVDLAWAAVPYATSYNVYSIPAAGGSPTLIGTSSQTTFARTNLVNGTTYRFAVAGVRSGVAGASAEVVAVPHISDLSALPTQGLTLALSASELAYGQADNSVVSAWPNAAGPWLTALGSGSWAPKLVHSAIGGRAAVRFDGLNDYLTLPGGFQDFTAGMSLYVVMRPSAQATSVKVVLLGNGIAAQNIGFGLLSDTSAFQYFNNSSWGEYSYFGTPGGMTAGEASLVAVHQNGGAVDSHSYAELTKNGVSLFGQNVFVPPVATRSLNYIAKTYFNEGLFQGDVAEILLYNRKLSTAENAAVQAYVAGKYGLTMGGSTPTLGAPTNPVATAGNGSISLSWSAVQGATRYRVYRSTTSGGPYALVASPTATSYSNTGLTNGTTYYYVLRAFNATLVSADSQPVSATPTAAALAPPTGVTATAGNGAVTVRWNAVSGASAYRVYRGTTSGGSYTLLASTTSRSYSNTGLTNGTTYYYVVRAYNSTIQSIDSQQVSATPSSAPPAAPVGVSATPGNGSAALSWAAVSGATGYRVYRGTTSGGPYALVASPTAASYSNTGLTNGTTYYYVVRTFNGTLESVNSAQVSATPSAPLPSPDPALPAAGRLLVLDAQTAALQFANGAAVTTWSDISGGVRHAAASGTSTPTLVTNAINGRPALRFDGVDDYMTLPTGFQDFTVGTSLYVVMRPSVVPAFSFKIFALGNGGGQESIGLSRSVEGSGFLFWNSNVAGQYSWMATSTGLLAGETSLVSVLQDGGTVGGVSYAELAKNGVSLAGQNLFVPPVANRFVNYIGKSYWGNEGPYQGDIAEIILYNRKLSAAENAAVLTYLSNKYGLQVLPTLPNPDPALPVAGRLLVLDAQVAAQQVANGAAITSWSDISGGARNAVATGTATPMLITNAINGRAVLRFDGVDDHMTLPGGFQDFTAGMSLYVVMRPSAVPAFSFKIFALGNGGGLENIGLSRAVDNPGLLFWNSNAAGQYSWFATSGGLLAGETSLVSVLQDAGAVGGVSYAELAKNGVALAGQNMFVPPVANRFVNYIGKSYWSNEGPFQGDIAEIILYNRKLSAAEHGAVKTYIANKYGLSITP